MSEFMIKAKRPGGRAFYFITGNGALNRLRIHGARFADKDGKTGEERAKVTAADCAASHPDWQFKVVPGC